MSLSDPPDPLDLLPKMQRDFVLAYVGKAAGNGAEAARLAGYSPASANVTGSRLLANPRVDAALTSARSKVSEVRTLERETVRAIAEAATAQDQQELKRVQDRVLQLADREAVVDALMTIALAKPEKRKLENGEEYHLPLPKRSDQVAAARALSSMEGWDAPVRVAGKVEHSGHVTGLPTSAELASMSDAEIEQRLAKLSASADPVADLSVQN